MTRRAYFGLAILGLAAAVLTAIFQRSPGYMDADYYFAGGVRLAQGHGFSEDILWHYLDDPSGIPHPSHGYWMPLASMVAALGMFLTGSTQFWAARWPFILLAACLPPLAARLSWELTCRKRHALIAGLLAVFSGFYLPYLPITETFALYLLFGGLFLLLVQSAAGGAARPAGRMRLARPLLLGALAGGMHLARADGLLWLVVAGFAVLILSRYEAPPAGRSRLQALAPILTGLGLVLAGYLLVMGPWMLRNLSVFGAPLAPGGSRALWLTLYDELYAYPGSRLNMAHWWSSGVPAILQARLEALWTNLQSTLVVEGSIFLAPLILAGVWRLRRSPAVQTGVIAYLLTLAAFTVIFPYQGIRGAFMHSGAAYQMVWWAAAPAGLEALVEWGGRKRGWNVPQAGQVFSAGLLIFALIFTGYITLTQLFGKNPAGQGWDAPWQRYTAVESALVGYGAAPGASVVVNNAPGYYVAARRPAISIPYGDRETLLSAARRYGADYLLVELDQVQGEKLYEQPGDRPGLRYLGAESDVKIYEILQP